MLVKASKIIIAQNTKKSDFVKQQIADNIGKSIVIKEYHKQTKKLLNEYIGEIVTVYKNLFLTKIFKGKLIINKTFCYNDFSIGILDFEIENA